MKKSILFGCVATCALGTVGIISAPAAAEVAPTADEVRSAIVSQLTGGIEVDRSFDASAITVTPKGQDFDVTFPAVQNKKVTIPARTIHLTHAGEFNGKSQYKVESVYESIRDLIKDLLPTATLTTEAADINMVWVPAYNLVSKKSQNVRGLKFAAPDMKGTVSVGQIVSDSLVRAVSDTKMDASDSTDVRDVNITVENAVVEVPLFSYESTTTGADITTNPLVRELSSSSDISRISIPTIRLKMEGAADAVASFAVNALAAFKDERLHSELNISQISSPALAAFVPAVMIPTEATLNFDILNIKKDIVLPLVEAGQNGTFSDKDVPLLKRACETGALRLNLLGAKNTAAGIAATGEFRLRLKDSDKVMTLKDFETHLEPVVNAKIMITNLDKISPAPTVNQVECDRAKASLAALPDEQKPSAEWRVSHACRPQGGPLDPIRPFIDLNKRTTDANGATLDTITVQYDNDTLTVNGQVLFQKGPNR